MWFADPRDFTGQTLELRGWLRRDNVSGWAGLWLREDGPGGVLQSGNVQAQGISGTADWSEFRVTLPLDARTRTLAFGALLAGTGKLWLDDLRLFADGKSLTEEATKPRPPTALERDTSFTALFRITLEHPSRVQVENLVLLGKVWGFLKYHHPAVVQGDRHWDFDLFRTMPAVLAAKDATTAQHVISAWVDYSKRADCLVGNGRQRWRSPASETSRSTPRPSIR